MKKQSGFSAIEGLLILVAVVILGGTGWYVYNARNKTNNTYSTANQVSSSTPTYPKTIAKKSATGPTANWIVYSNKDGIYSLKYPKTWATATHPELCAKGILLLGVDANSVGVCGSENFGQIGIVSVIGDSQKSNELTTGYKGVTTTSVTVDNVKGEKQTATASGQAASGAPNALADGTKVTKYIFYTNNWTYTATYVSADLQGNAYTDALSDFDTMVTSTLKFSA